MTLHDDIERVVAAADFGMATARKTGRNPRWPYVPVLKHTAKPGEGVDYVTQLRGLAYETRQEAISAAERYIEAERRALAKRLAEPRHRAVREQYGLPREIGRTLTETADELRSLYEPGIKEAR